jgi:hypothetical protein
MSSWAVLTFGIRARLRRRRLTTWWPGRAAAGGSVGCDAWRGRGALHPARSLLAVRGR